VVDIEAERRWKGGRVDEEETRGGRSKAQTNSLD
jgi:hypothetical protein